MMSDLIKREDAIRAVAEVLSLNRFASFKNIKDFGRFAERMLRNVPSADRPQGEWIGYEVPSECSVCGHCWDEYVFGQEIWYDGSVPNYCPHCGARMFAKDINVPNKKGADDEGHN